MSANTQEFRLPIDFKDKTPFFIERFFSIHPSFTDHKNFRLPSFTEIFGREAPIAAEFCSGNGEWIVEKAKSFPELNWIAVEKRFDRVRKIWARAKRLKADNLFVVWADARTFTEFYLPESSLARVFINFPDPWPKRRHAKHRLMQDEFISSLSRAVKTQGEVILATDDALYSEMTIQIMMKSSLWRSFFDAPYFVHEWENFGASFFQDLWQKKARKIYYQQFINKK